ncbi:MAG: SDR family NAD(P)-dependent oxidoreductase [Myxococcota bacterium]
MEELEGRVAVITGGASGIGRAVARRLAREAMRLVLADRDPDGLAEAKRELDKDGADVLTVPTDVGDLEQVRELADRTFDHFGAAHVVFNNAGVAAAGRVWELAHEDWEWMLRVNLWGVIHGVEVFVPRLLEQGQPAHVISTASFAGLVPNFGLGAYCVSKYGVVALMECLARELRGTEIGVSVLCPMMVSTRIGEHSSRDRPSTSEPLPETLEPSGRPPEGRVLEPEAVAEQVVSAIRRRDLYILTHAEAREPIRRRFERIDRAFSD